MRGQNWVGQMNDSINALIKDTVYCYTKPLIDGAQKDFFSTPFSIAEALTLMGILLAIYQFRKQMKETRNSTLKAQKENWYLNVIVLPQLENIDTFYKDFINTLSDELREIKSDATHMVAARLDLKIAEKKQNLKSDINDKLEHITVLVRSFDTTLGSDVSSVVMELEDACTDILDHYNINTLDTVRKAVLKNKQKLISELNKGLSQNN